jgi:hypothetical protein
MDFQRTYFTTFEAIVSTWISIAIALNERFRKPERNKLKRHSVKRDF